MSPVGKVFVVLNLMLAALFLGFAASLLGTSGEFKSKYEAEVTARAADQAAFEEQIASLEVQTSTLKEELGRSQLESQSTSANLKATQDDLQTERTSNSELRESVSGINTQLGGFQENIRDLQRRIATLEDENRSLRESRDGAMDERDSSSLALNREKEAHRGTQQSLSDAQAELARISEQLGHSEAMLATAQRLYNIDWKTIGQQPHLEGVVLEARSDGPMATVLLSLGGQDGVKRGYTFDVYRGGAYKGQVQVEVVNATNAAAYVTRASGAAIERGDTFVTNL